MLKDVDTNSFHATTKVAQETLSSMIVNPPNIPKKN